MSRVALLALLVLAVYLPGIAARDLWAPDEPRYAQVSREMAVDGHWLVPHLNGQLYDQKPPLFFWMVAAVGALRGGVDEVAVRLPSVLSALGTALLVYGLGRRLFSPEAGWLAALVFATSSGISWQGRVGQIDMMLTFFVVLAVYCWVRGWQGEPAWHPGFFVAAGLATLAKGPVGLVAPLVSVLAFLALQRDARTLREMRLGRGLLLWAAVVLAWLAPAVAAAGRDYLSYLLFDQTVHRYAAGTQHPRPFWWYLPYLAAGFFPFVFLLPAGVRELWRRQSEDGSATEIRRRAAFLCTWAMSTLIFFSLSPSKRGVYIVAIYAPLSLLVGAGAARMVGRGSGSRAVAAALLASALVMAALVALLPYAAGRERDLVDLLEPGLPFAVGVTAVVAAAGSALAAVLAARRRLRGALHTASGAMAATWLLLAAWVLPKLEPIKSARPLATTFAQVAQADETYGLYGRPLHAAFVFYAGRHGVHLPERAELEAWLRAPGRRWLVVRRDQLEALGGDVSGMVELISERDPRRGWVLLTSHPAPSLAAVVVDAVALRTGATPVAETLGH